MAPSVVREIRRQHAAGQRIVDIALEWGIRAQTVDTIVRRVTYRNVPEEGLHRGT